MKSKLSTTAQTRSPLSNKRGEADAYKALAAVQRRSQIQAQVQAQIQPRTSQLICNVISYLTRRLAITLMLIPLTTSLAPSLFDLNGRASRALHLYGVAHAQNSKSKAKAAFKRGQLNYKKKRYVKALNAFQEAYRLYPRPVMIYNSAKIYEQLELFPEALKSYEAFIATGKDQGGAAQSVQKIKTRLAGWTEVLLTSDPSGAEVRLYNANLPALGRTPLSRKMPPNRSLKVFLKPTNGDSFMKRVKIPKQKQKTLKIKIPKRPAWVRVIGSPQRARVKSGSVKRRGLPTLMKLSVGDHELEVYASDYLPVKKLVTLRAVHTKKNPLTVQIDLKSNEGVALISLNVKQDGSLLLMNGEARGRSPFNEPIEVPEGEHLIELKGPSGQEFSERLSLKSGEAINFNIDFSQTESWLTRDRALMGVMSVGGASLLTGVILGAVAWSNASSLEECRVLEQCARRQDELNRAHAVRTYALSADILIGLGIALSATGGVLYWLDHRVQSRPMAQETQVTPQVSVSPLPGGVNVSGSFNF